MERMLQHIVRTVTSTRNIMILHMKQRYEKNATTPSNNRYYYQEHYETIYKTAIWKECSNI
jgi:hypothetical protein